MRRIDPWAEKLGDQVSMVSHDLDTIEARTDDACRRGTVGVNNLGNQPLRHDAGKVLTSLAHDGRGGVRYRDGAVVGAAGDIATAGMIELAEERGAMGMDRLGDHFETRDAVIIVDIDPTPSTDGCLVDRGRLHDDKSDATSGARGKIGGILLGYVAARGHGTAVGGHDDAVFQLDVAKRKRLEKMRKARRHHGLISSQSTSLRSTASRYRRFHDAHSVAPR